MNRSILASVTPGDRSALLRFGQTLYCFLSLGAIVIALLLMAGYSFTPMAVKSGQTPTFFLAVGLSGAPRAE